MRKSYAHSIALLEKKDDGAHPLRQRGVRKASDGLASTFRRTSEQLSAAAPSDKQMAAFDKAFAELAKGKEWLPAEQLRPLLARVGVALSSAGADAMMLEISPHGVNNAHLHWSEAAWVFAQVLRGDGDFDGPGVTHGLSLLPEEVRAILGEKGVPSAEIEALLEREAAHGEVRPDVVLGAFAPRDAAGPEEAARVEERKQNFRIRAQWRKEEREHKRVQARREEEQKQMMAQQEAERLRAEAAEQKRVADEEKAFYRQVQVQNREAVQEARKEAMARHRQMLDREREQRQLEAARVSAQQMLEEKERQRRQSGLIGKTPAFS